MANMGGEIPELASTSPEPSKNSKRTSIEDLPNELLSNIFEYLDGPQPSTPRLFDEPVFEVTESDVTTLKSASQVSKRWRRAILPTLFMHARFIVSDPFTHTPNIDNEIPPFLKFVTKNSLSQSITTFALIVADKEVGSDKDRDFSTFWKSLFATIDPVELLIVAPAEALGALTSCYVITEDARSFDCPFHYLRLQRPCPSNKGKRVEAHEPVKESSTIENSREVSAQSSSSLDLLDDAPRDTLPRQDGSYLSAVVSEDHEEWMNPRIPAETSAVFEIRPWTTLLLNEGAFLKAYSTYEFWVKEPPSILPDLVGVLPDAAGADAPPHTPLISPTIRDMSYIGIFPMSGHFSRLTKNCPRLHRLYVQLVPRNNILENESKMQQVESEDLWMERNSCYALLMRELFSVPPTANYKDLQVFESGDAADTDAWHMAVEFVKRAGNGWKVASDGVFVRDSKKVASEPAEGHVNDDLIDGSIFTGSLIKWAFNGTVDLPVSSFPWYVQPLEDNFDLGFDLDLN